jgi:hypothetical protein
MWLFFVSTPFVERSIGAEECDTFPQDIMGRKCIKYHGQSSPAKDVLARKKYNKFI